MDKSISRESMIKLAMESYQQGKIDAWSGIKQTLVGLARQQDNIDLSKTVTGIDFVIHGKEYC